MYGKIFTSMYDGTLADNWQALVTFQQLIVLADADGNIDMTPHAINRRTGIPLDIIETGLKALSGDDLYSRTPDENGKRISLIDSHKPWGWYIVNYEKYKRIANSDDAREQTRLRVAKHREAKKQQEKQEKKPSNNNDIGKCNVTKSLHVTDSNECNAIYIKNIDINKDINKEKDIDKTKDKEKDLKKKEINKLPKTKPANAGKKEPKSKTVWIAYANAYQSRYGNTPLRNASINSILCKFVDNVGLNDAPLIAEYYLSLNDRWYLQKFHDVGSLLQNAQAIRTQWLNNSNQTSIDHRNNERRSTTAQAGQRIIDKINRGEL